MQVISSDLLRGHIDAFVLAALMRGEKYGAEIKNNIAAKTKNLYVPNEQSLYSAYHRLERDGKKAKNISVRLKASGKTQKFFWIFS